MSRQKTCITISFFAIALFAIHGRDNLSLIAEFFNANPYEKHMSTIRKRAVANVNDNPNPLPITPDKATVTNKCSYPVWIASTPPPGCPPGGQEGWIQPGEKWQEKAANCEIGNTALKVYKEQRRGGDEKTNPPMQFEYGKSRKQNLIDYNLSFVDCVRPGSDLSKCAGRDGGLMIGSNGKCHVFRCSPNEDCCTQGYCDSLGSAARQGPFGNEPNVACLATHDAADTTFDELGVNIELCSGG